MLVFDGWIWFDFMKDKSFRSSRSCHAHVHSVWNRYQDCVLARIDGALCIAVVECFPCRRIQIGERWAQPEKRIVTIFFFISVSLFYTDHKSISEIFDRIFREKIFTCIASKKKSGKVSKEKTIYLLISSSCLFYCFLFFLPICCCCCLYVVVFFSSSSFFVDSNLSKVKDSERERERERIVIWWGNEQEQQQQSGRPHLHLSWYRAHTNGYWLLCP